MSHLPASVWREIEKASVYLPQDCREHVGRFIGLGHLRTILNRSKRTSPQNALLWSLYSDILALGGEQLGGWSTADLHEFLLGEWSGWEVHEAFGAKRQKPVRRSSRLTKAEFSEYLEFICQRMAEHGIYLTLPGDLDSALGDGKTVGRSRELDPPSSGAVL